jgi:nucleotide-binding universal stress UspA family protein
MIYEKIMVPLDGSNAAEIALPYAEEIAARLGAEIILVSVSGPTVEAKDHLYRSYLDKITEQVRGRLDDWGAKEGAKVQSEVFAGKPASEILRYADENNVSLIAMASRGRSGRGPWLLGNIAAKVLRATQKPVLLIRAPADETALQQRSLVAVGWFQRRRGCLSIRGGTDAGIGCRASFVPSPAAHGVDS